MLLAESVGATADTYFTVTSLGTLTGASIAVVAVTNTVRKLSGREWTWLPFITSLLIIFVSAWTASSLNGPADWVMGFLNACLLYCTALGIQTTALTTLHATAQPRAAGQEKLQAAPVAWLSPWTRTATEEAN